MPTDNIETKLEKEKQVKPDTDQTIDNIDVELNRIEAEAEATTTKNWLSLSLASS